MFSSLCEFCVERMMNETHLGSVRVGSSHQGRRRVRPTKGWRRLLFDTIAWTVLRILFARLPVCMLAPNTVLVYTAALRCGPHYFTDPNSLFSSPTCTSIQSFINSLQTLHRFRCFDPFFLEQRVSNIYNRAHHVRMLGVSYNLAMNWRMPLSFRAPTNWSTFWPSLNAMTVGSARTWC